MRFNRTSRPKRPGVVLLGVLIVIVILALIAYQYSDRMVAEYMAANNAHRASQAKAFADSGIYYAAAMVATPDNITNLLNGNPYDNPDKFDNILIPDSSGNGAAGRFTLIAPVDPDQTTTGAPYRAGVTDECGKININAIMKRDSTGQTLYDMLVKLPNMTEDIAASIVDWVDSDSEPREGGAEDDYYSGMTPGYRAKNGPLDSLDELLLVKGVTRELLYGADLNRNGIADVNEEFIGANIDYGWSAFLTVSSREANRDGSGQPLINVNGSDLTDLTDKLGPVVGDDLAKFIVLYRQYGPASSSGSSQTLGSAIASLLGVARNKSSGTVVGDLSSYQPDLQKKASKKLTSFFDLVTAQVNIPGSGKIPTQVFISPLKDQSSITELLPKLYESATLTDDAELPARININTAPREVLSTIPDLSDADVATIISLRPKWDGGEPLPENFATPTWLISDATLSLTTLRNLEKVITTKSQVFHMRAVGRFDNGTGPTARVEAIVDTNFGRPRIILYRDWTELGRTKLPQQ